MKVTKEELIKQVQELAKKLGRTPKIKNFKNYNKAIYRFGSWNIFLKEAKLAPNQMINNFDNLTNEELLELIGLELDRIDSTTFADYNKYKSKKAPSFSYIKKRTGFKWNEMLETLNKKINLKKMTDEELLQQLKDVADKIGKPPSKNDLFDRGINADIYHLKFGSYNKAIELAGLEINLSKSKVIHSDEELLKMYIKLCKKIGKAATTKDIDRYLKYSSNVFVTRFGSINTLRELAGYEKVNYSKKYSKEKIKKMLIELYEKHHRRLTIQELDKIREEDEDFPSISTICRHFSTTKISEVWDEIERTCKENIELIEEVQTLAKKLGKTPTVDDFKLSWRVLYKFDTWNSFIEEAGLKPNAVYRTKKNLTKNEVIEIVRNELKRIGSRSSSKYIENHSANAPSYHIIKKTLEVETWNEVLKKIGFSPNDYNGIGKVKQPLKCKVSYCNKTARAKGHCGKHYQQLKRYGKIKDTPTKEEKRQYTERTRRRKTPINNKSGVKGVRVNKSGTYTARIISKGKEYCLGTFNTLEEAKKARLEGEKKYWGKIYTKS